MTELRCPLCDGCHGNNSRCQRIVPSLEKLHRYIDINIIDDYAVRDFSNGYSLEVDTLNYHCILNFIMELMKNDAETRERIFDRMQQLIDERVPIRELNDRTAAGFYKETDPHSGQEYWERWRGF